MPTSSKRNANQQQQKQSAPQGDDYDEYVYYPYYPKSVPGGGYEYVQEPQDSKEHKQPTEQYYDEPESNNSAPVQRT
jgi:hypothetical protein